MKTTFSDCMLELKQIFNSSGFCLVTYVFEYRKSIRMYSEWFFCIISYIFVINYNFKVFQYCINVFIA